MPPKCRDTQPLAPHFATFWYMFFGVLTLESSNLHRQTRGPTFVRKTVANFGPMLRPHCSAWIWSHKCAQILVTKLGPPNLQMNCRPSHVHTHFLDQNTVSFCSSFLILHFRICPQWHGPMPIMKIRTKEKPSTTATTKASQYSKALRTTLSGQHEETP